MKFRWSLTDSKDIFIRDRIDLLIIVYEDRRCTDEFILEIFGIFDFPDIRNIELWIEIEIDRRRFRF